MRTSFVVKSLLAAAAALAPLASQAESSLVTGNGANLTATARVDFVIQIPKYVFLRVGTGTPYTTLAGLGSVATVDLITFAPTMTQVGSGTAIAGTGGDFAGNNGTETAALLSNAGSVTLNCSTVAALSDGTGDTISFTQITTTVATLTSATALPAPTLTDGACTAVTVSPPGGSKVINRDATWTYKYANTAVVPGGTYGGAGGTNNGRVTYTAVLP